MSLDSLISVLMDGFAREDERDDAAIDLGDSDAPEALAALIQAGSDPGVPDTVQASCGESIADIWIRRGNYDYSIWQKLCSPTRNELINTVAKQRPEWLTDEEELKQI
jgi:hypothetical protein